MAARQSEGLPRVGEDPPLTLAEQRTRAIAEQRARVIAELLHPGQDADGARRRVVSAVLQGSHGRSHIIDQPQQTRRSQKTTIQDAQVARGEATSPVLQADPQAQRERGGGGPTLAATPPLRDASAVGLQAQQTRRSRLTETQRRDQDAARVAAWRAQITRETEEEGTARRERQRLQRRAQRERQRARGAQAAAESSEQHAQRRDRDAASHATRPRHPEHLFDQCPHTALLKFATDGGAGRFTHRKAAARALRGPEEGLPGGTEADVNAHIEEVLQEEVTPELAEEIRERVLRHMDDRPDEACDRFHAGGDRGAAGRPCFRAHVPACASCGARALASCADVAYIPRTGNRAGGTTATTSAAPAWRFRAFWVSELQLLRCGGVYLQEIRALPVGVRRVHTYWPQDGPVAGGKTATMKKR